MQLLQSEPFLYEFFCGSGEISRAFNSAGFTTCKIDIRQRKGKCMPDIRGDILKMSPAHLSYNNPQVIYAAVPCNAFSNAAGNYYRDGTGYKESTHYFQKLLKKTLEFVEHFLTINPDLIYYIENPRASLRYNKMMIDFLARTSGTIKTCTLGSYGFATIKPTDIFTNYQALKLRPLLNWGKGAKNPGKSFDNLTTHARQSTPFEFGLDLATQTKKHLELQKQQRPSNFENFNTLQIHYENSTSLDDIRDVISD